MKWLQLDLLLKVTQRTLKIQTYGNKGEQNTCAHENIQNIIIIDY